MKLFVYCTVYLLPIIYYLKSNLHHYFRDLFSNKIYIIYVNYIYIKKKNSKKTLKNITKFSRGWYVVTEVDRTVLCYNSKVESNG